jgi:hypothetical protein
MAKRRIHRVPHERIKAILERHGIRSVNQAVEWGAAVSERVIMCQRCVRLGDMLDRKGVGDQFPAHCHWGERGCRERKFPLVSAKSIEGIVRGKRVLGVEFDRADQILCALEDTEAWYTDLAEWYYPKPPNHEAEYETFLSQPAAFTQARALIVGIDGLFLS